MTKRTGGEIVRDRLLAERVPYLVGIPGHGIVAMLDAFRTVQDQIKILQVRHEQSAVHLADGYYRVSGQPLAVFTSIGPGALNTAIGLGASYVDSTAALVMSGETHTYMEGRGVLQELERKRPADIPSVLEPLVKASYRPRSQKALFDDLASAFREMTTGRPGPTFISLPMDVQAESDDVPTAERTNVGDAEDLSSDALARIDEAVKLLANAKRPVLVAGGGVTLANAEAPLIELAERVGAAVVTTLQGKGCFPEDHPLYGWHLGTKGTSIGNALTTTADVILAVGTRFTDQVASSFRAGTTFASESTSLIQIDIDSRELGKNYELELGIQGDAAHVISAINAGLTKQEHSPNYESSDYFPEIQQLRQTWLDETAELRESNAVPSTVPRFYKELREVLDRDAIVVTSSGHAQACLLEFPFYEPKTNLTSGGFSTMGWSYPAALGAKLADPDRQVVAVIGDGDFMMTMQEMATAKEYGINVVIVLLNNYGWYSIRDLQMAEFGEDRAIGIDWDAKKSPDFVTIARGFGLYSESVEQPDDIQAAVDRALAHDGPSLVEVKVARDFPNSGSTVVGWWDVPIPTYLEDRRAKYEQARKEIEPPPT
ncbi:MAG: thiamine pyrophosphate-binding protein [Dehalococcoidia bacterium]|nr:acetolactate synthase [Chloroflexota bacterium]MDP6055467.1 thiamine pyrophosphate-binding protein [Dehalococcoidia bacterium]MDP7090868.1 thiamine pyrophosphate-binding protein [Dehalococcoidia bacterium]MDP7261744.1 thiamine pyrophosphate-binding protein [Dehalococcoidia bacterium]MDP7484556.1 thiamine pyrophosphate-binding protein [Dehalococcoidia bacterium]